MIKEGTYFMKRYEILTLKVPHHQSASCINHLAIDRGNPDDDLPIGELRRDVTLKDLGSLMSATDMASQSEMHSHR